MRKLQLVVIGLLSFFSLSAAEWQWSVSIDKMISPETGKYPQAFWWILV